MESLFGPSWLWVSVLGIVAGTISGMLGVGSGVIVTPALVLLFSFPQKSAQGIALITMVPMALASAIRYYNNPSITIDLKVTILLTVTAIVGAILGSGIAFSVPSVILKKTFAVFVIFSGIMMIVRGK